MDGEQINNLMAVIDGLKTLNDGRLKKDNQVIQFLPRYDADLNSVHSVWEKLSSSEKELFESNLYDIIVGGAAYNRNDDAPYITNATARERCLAMIKTKHLDF